MIVHDVAQGSSEWHRLRMAIPTASSFDKIFTPTGKLSTQSRKYAYKIIAAKLLGYPMDDVSSSEWMERGKSLEASAVQQYEAMTDLQTQSVGFITSDDGLVGCSPDRLVGDDGLLEIKCPAPFTHVGYLADGFDMQYKPQVQGQLWITGRSWCDWFSFHPEMPSVQVRAERDDAYIVGLAEGLREFNVMRTEMLERIKAKGFFAERENIMAAHEREYAADTGERFLTAG